jgi:predicted Zn-dependent protease
MYSTLVFVKEGCFVHRRRIPAAFRALAFAVVATLASTSLAAPANPYDKFRSATYSNQGLASENDEFRLGSQVHQQIMMKYPVVHDPRLNEYVQSVGERIARVSKRPNLQYQFFVIQDSSINAFSIPGGFVYVNTGLLDIVQSEDELAAVLAHEIGHVVARHGLRNYKKAQRTSVWTGILGTAAVIATGGSIGGQAANAAVKLFGAGILTRNSRDFEREADFLGLYDLDAAGYEPVGMIRIFERLGQHASSTKSSIGGIFADHPDSGERIKNTEIEIEQHFGGKATLASSSGRARPRRAMQASNTAFVEMKRALADVASGRRQTRAGRNYDPRSRGDVEGSAPIENNRPVLRRKSPEQP